MEGKSTLNGLDGPGAIPGRLIRTLLWDRSYPVRLRRAIRRLHASAPSLQPVLYREADIERILEKHPEYRNTYANLSHRIMKADMSRLLILHEFGGWYKEGYRRGFESLEEPKTWIANCITTAFHNNRHRYGNIAVVERDEAARYLKHRMTGTWRRQVTSAFK
jgi:mannosyltransferase OCH1-like enzyme